MGTTSLLQVVWLQQSFFPGPGSWESVGVITYKKTSLVSSVQKSARVRSGLLTILPKTTKHLTSVGAHPDTPVYGLPEHDKAIFKGVLEETIPCKS